MNKTEIIAEIYKKKSFLCIGLDTDLSKIPSFLLEADDPVFEFNKQIIDATKDLCVAYKINTAFYEANGKKGWESMEKTLAYIPENIFTIADAKRGDIGNTSTQYARAFFETMNFHSITVAPYMGRDSVKPFLEFQNKWAIVLALTSNEGAYDFQYSGTGEERLFETVLRTVAGWGSPENLMFVIGATKGEQFKSIREIVPDHFLLIPGVGTQGGSLETVCRHAMNKDAGILVNVSRQIIYAGADTDFAGKARTEALNLQKKMALFL